MDDYPTCIDVCDGKYTIIYDLKTGQSECLRYGEKWRDLYGDKMVLAMFDTIVELRERAAEVEGLKEYINQLEVFRAMLSGLVHYLTNNYGDDHWDSTIREVFMNNIEIFLLVLLWCLLGPLSVLIMYPPEE